MKNISKTAYLSSLLLSSIISCTLFEFGFVALHTLSMGFFCLIQLDLIRGDIQTYTHKVHVNTHTLTSII